MSELRVEAYEMPGVPLGPENPLPSLRNRRTPDPPVKFADDVPEEERKYFGYGCDVGPLPHRVQDSYTRRRRVRSFKALVLENDILRAAFLIELGGRLWSLYHKPTRRELLYVNPVFQPANLAVRDAWFSGGVEWNVGIRGHTPYTCSPLFAARVDGGSGNPILRMYEWDRVRGTPYQMDFSLPDGSPWLFMHARLVNPNGVEVPMYWWSNIAATERPDVRVIVPAERALFHSPPNMMRRGGVPDNDGVDNTYATNLNSSASIFYDIPHGQRPWIAALDKEGRGLVQTSTQRLLGRKLFAWGGGPGGRHWQQFLSVPDRPYIEIQAGITRTQEQCLPMPAGAEWTWTEAYGLMEADAPLVHGRDWSAARRVIAGRLEALLPQAQLESDLRQGDRTALQPPAEILHRGSGWGALEMRRRARAGQPPFCGGEMLFDDVSLVSDQSPWLSLLEKGDFPSGRPQDSPGAWMIQPEWRSLLEEALRAGRSDHWLSWLHLGVMHYENGETEKARHAWKKSIALTPSAWAWRNLAVMAKHEGKLSDAADLWCAAYRMLPQCIPLILECSASFLDAGRLRELQALLPELAPSAREHGRVKILTAKAALEAGDMDTAERILRSDIEIANMREGEGILTDLWFSLHEKRIAAAEGVPVNDALKERVRREFPPPQNLDFRMQVTSGL
jgi:tetratricopeptide (TPR) repeat protein